MHGTLDDRATADHSLWSRLKDGVKRLFPGYFALVMATGIVSVASSLSGFRRIAMSLLWVNAGAYTILALLLLARLICYPRQIWDDLRNHGRGPGFFTVVAGTCVLGTQSLIVAGYTSVAHVLWLTGVGCWVIVMYGFFTGVTLNQKKPSLEVGINGAWLIAIVATQAVSVLGSLLAPHLESTHLVLFFALCMYLLGAMLYLTVITLIFYRFTFLRMTMEGLTPPYWINMGAVAITTLAGCTLLLARDALPLLDLLRSFLTGFTLFFWATATWWIPLLIILGIWRHAVRRFPFRYDPQYWGMVFPLGMYTVCTFRLAQVTELDDLLVIPRYFVYPALVAWSVTFLAMLFSLVKASRRAAPSTAASEHRGAATSGTASPQSPRGDATGTNGIR